MFIGMLLTLGLNQISGFLPLISGTANRFVVLGCDEVGLISELDTNKYFGGCLTVCSGKEDISDGPCSGLGCCETLIPEGMQTYWSSVLSLHNHTTVWSFNKCGYSFLAEEDRFTFRGVRDLIDESFRNTTVNNVPLVLEWGIVNGTCEHAFGKEDLAKYVCQGNTSCSNLDTGVGGYLCTCLPGYEGNPYLVPGCTGKYF